jgi:lipopolysaccharide/colanic/teichoic acid biosynthesis glycosyltransferase
MNDTFYSRSGKRCLDLLAASLGLLVISPFLAIVVVAVKFSSPGPALFRQIRVGRFGQPFEMLKFRSMKVAQHPGSGLTACDDPRITPLGAWLRVTKIDELPQLFNVLLGQMSLVGPRPEVPEFTAHYTTEQRRVLDVRPGMTGLSADIYEEQLLADRENKEKFYVECVMPQKLATDLRYCETASLSADLRIIGLTFFKLLRRIYKPYNRMPDYSRASLEIHPSKK